jgi:hypothetical protein
MTDAATLSLDCVQSYSAFCPFQITDIGTATVVGHRHFDDTSDRNHLRVGFDRVPHD